jgi:CBS domain-containing protein
MIISNHMKRNVISIHATASVREAAAVFVKYHIGLLPVVDGENRPIGVVGLRDMLSLELPDFINFIADVDFVHDFGAVETTHPPAEVLDQPIQKLMITPITVDEETGLLRAYSLMLQHHLHDIPVISREGKLVGVASRVDIGVAILSAWEKVE